MKSNCAKHLREGSSKVPRHAMASSAIWVMLEQSGDMWSSLSVTWRLYNVRQCKFTRNLNLLQTANKYIFAL